MKSLLLFKKFRFVLIGKKIDFDLSKMPDQFCNMWKKVVFGDKNSDLCLLHKIKSFDLKKYQICF